MPTALFLSPHLDDVAFSCGGTLARLSDEGWTTMLCTVFTASVPTPTGFALACQTDKGIAPDVDYMALRRREDDVFAERIGADTVRHLGFPEAPHRGYGSAFALFSGIHDGDPIYERVGEALVEVIDAFTPDLVLAPQGIGHHVDHLHTIKAVEFAQAHLPEEEMHGGAVPRHAGPHRTVWYRDTPYAVDPSGGPAAASPLSALLNDTPGDTLDEAAVLITDVLDRKLDAVAAYASQLDFQFGGAPGMRRKLAHFAYREAERLGLEGAAEAFCTLPDAPLPDLFATGPDA